MEHVDLAVLKNILNLDDNNFIAESRTAMPQLIEAYEELKHELDAAVEALKFYADERSWNPVEAFSENTEINSEDHYCTKGDYFFGGKRARAVLAMIDRGEKNV